MYFKNIKPISASLRNKVVVKRPRAKKCKGLLINQRRAQGRGICGTIISRGKGGGNLFRYRYVNYSSFVLRMPGIFLGYDFDNYRTGWLGLVKCINGSYQYILAAANMEVGSTLKYYKVGDSSNYLNLGERVPLSMIPKGSWVYNISHSKFQNGLFARAAGTGCLLKLHNFIKGFSIVRLPSRQLRQLPHSCFGNLGRVSNESHFLEHFSKAGVRYIFNYRPKVRGEAMNAVDHHHGGKTKGGKKPKTPWGKIVKR